MRTILFSLLLLSNQIVANLIDQNNLPKELLDYIHFLEAELEVPIKIVSVGPNRSATINR